MISETTIRLEVWSDVQCIWCYVGNARWKRAIAQFPGVVQVVHRSFELQPGFPVEFDAQTYLESERGMDAREQERAFAEMKRITTAEGLAYEPTRIRPTNSHLALELMHHAETVGLRAPLAERLYGAYFSEGHHIGTVDSLIDLAADAGLDKDAARHALETGTFAAVVDGDTEAARALGARGAPFAVIDDRYAVPGALDVDSLRGILNQVAAA
jgi:predicted DsbA family dithiol-disulfide isomerase